MKLTVEGMTIEGTPEECLQFLRLQKQESMKEWNRKQIGLHAGGMIVKEIKNHEKLSDRRLHAR